MPEHVPTDEDSGNHQASDQCKGPQTATLTPGSIFKTNVATIGSLILLVATVVAGYVDLKSGQKEDHETIVELVATVRELRDALLINNLLGPAARTELSRQRTLSKGDTQ